MDSWEIDGPERLEFGPVRAVHVSVVDGNVSVVASDAVPTLEVAKLSGPPLEVTYDSGELRIEHKQSGWKRFGVKHWSADMSVAVPRDCRVEVGSVSAPVVVSGVQGAVRVKGVSAELTLAGLGGPVEARSVSGAVEAQAIAGSLDAKTTSGDVTLIEGAGGSLRANTVSGSVTCDLGEATGGDLSFKTVSGDVTVRMPRDSDVAVTLRSVNGDVVSEFTELVRRISPGSRRADGKVGLGAGRLDAATVSGHIALLCSDAEPYDDGFDAGETFGAERELGPGGATPADSGGALAQ